MAFSDSRRALEVPRPGTPRGSLAGMTLAKAAPGPRSRWRGRSKT